MAPQVVAVKPSLPSLKMAFPTTSRATRPLASFVCLAGLVLRPADMLSASAHSAAFLVSSSSLPRGDPHLSVKGPMRRRHQPIPTPLGATMRFLDARGGVRLPPSSWDKSALIAPNMGIAASITAIRAGASSADTKVVPAWKRSIPNILTVLRLFAIPLLVWVLFDKKPGRQVLSSSIFMVASVTDWLDGYLARKWKISSAFGAFLDPVADKLMVATALILLTAKYRTRMVLLPTVVIICREIAVSALREWMASRSVRDAVAVGWWGKVKTATQMLAITFLLLFAPDVPRISPAHAQFIVWSIYLLQFSALLAVTSSWGYFQAAWPVLSGSLHDHDHKK